MIAVVSMSYEEEAVTAGKVKQSYLFTQVRKAVGLNQDGFQEILFIPLAKVYNFKSQT